MEGVMILSPTIASPTHSEGRENVFDPVDDRAVFAAREEEPDQAILRIQDG
jgi:hypothetical protein